MPHIELDVNFLTHPKTLGVSPLAELLHIRSIMYACQHLTDGKIPMVALPFLSNKFMDAGIAGLVEELVTQKLWHLNGNQGYEINDFLDYQLSKKEVVALVKAKREAGRRGGLARAKALLQAPTKPLLKRSASPLLYPASASASASASVSVKEEETIVGLIEFLNERTGKHFQARHPNGEPTKAHLAVSFLLKKGYTEVQIRQVIANRCLSWRNDPKTAEWLRPSTLFRPSNFTNYVGELGKEEIK